MTAVYLAAVSVLSDTECMKCNFQDRSDYVCNVYECIVRYVTAMYSNAVHMTSSEHDCSAHGCRAHKCSVYDFTVCGCSGCIVQERKQLKTKVNLSSICITTVSLTAV